MFFVGRYRSRDRLPSRPYNNIRTQSTFAPYKPSSKKAPWGVTNYCMLLLSGLLFGSMHLLAWNYGFATSYEKLLWRESSLIILTAGMIGVDICCAHLIRNKKPLKKAVVWYREYVLRCLLCESKSFSHFGICPREFTKPSIGHCMCPGSRFWEKFWFSRGAGECESKHGSLFSSTTHVKDKIEKISFIVAHSKYEKT